MITSTRCHPHHNSGEAVPMHGAFHRLFWGSSKQMEEGIARNSSTVHHITPCHCSLEMRPREGCNVWDRIMYMRCHVFLNIWWCRHLATLKGQLYVYKILGWNTEPKLHFRWSLIPNIVARFLIFPDPTLMDVSSTWFPLLTEQELALFLIYFHLK